MKKFLSATIILFVILAASEASAEIITVEGFGRYVIDKNSDKTFAEATKKARDEAKRLAAEQAGVIVKSHSVMIDHELDADIVETFLISLLENVKEFPEFDKNPEGDLVITCRVTATVDTSKIDLEKFLELDNPSEKAKLKERKQNKILIAKYESELDIYNFKNKNLKNIMSTAEKLAAVDPDNPAVFRTMIYVYLRENKIQNIIDYCEEILRTNSPVDLSIEACEQLGDIYLNDFKDNDTARKYVDKGIALVKARYTPAQIEKLVNNNDMQLVDLEFTGRTNTIRELYVLKSDIENINPSFEAVATISELTLEEDRIFNIRYRTDW